MWKSLTLLEFVYVSMVFLIEINKHMYWLLFLFYDWFFIDSLWLNVGYNHVVFFLYNVLLLWILIMAQ